MYYVLAAIFFIIVYFALAKILSSILKGCLVTVGIFVVLGAVFVFVKSIQNPVVLFNYITVDNFNVSFNKEASLDLGSWEGLQ